MALQGLLYKHAVAYLDDIISFGSDHESDLVSCEKVLAALDKAGLKINSTKCEFFQRETAILGHLVSTIGIKPLRSTVSAVLDFPKPKTIRQLRQFLGLSGYFRRFQKNYAATSLPLTNCLKKFNSVGKLLWDEQCDIAFDKIKNDLTCAPCLRHYDEDRENYLDVDSSLEACGAVLMQKDEETGYLHPIQYMSKKYSTAVMNYASVERELLALVFALNYFREFCLHKHTYVYTDCASLVFLKSFKAATSRLNRLSLSVTDFPTTIIYKKGSTNLAADALSRNPLPEILDESLVDPINFIESHESPVSPIKFVDINTLKQVNLKDEQDLDENIRNIKLAITNPELATDRDVRKSRRYVIVDGLLFFKSYDGKEAKNLLEIPKSLIPEVLQTYHDSKVGGHFGAWKTEHRIRQIYHWDGLSAHVKNYTRSCHECQMYRAHTKKPYGMLQFHVGSAIPFGSAQMDILGPLTPSRGKRYVLVLTDFVTRFAITRTLAKADSKTIISNLLSIANIFGHCSVIVTDAGSEFQNRYFKEFAQAMNLKHHVIPTFSHHCVGRAERYNFTLVKCLSHMISDMPSNWASYVDNCTFLYNITPTITTGYSPHYLLMGYHPKTGGEFQCFSDQFDGDLLKHLKVIQQLRATIPEVLRTAYEKQRKYYDARRSPHKFKPGDLVLVKNHKDHSKPYSKFQPRWTGPFSIVKQENDVTFQIEKLRYGTLTPCTVHVQNMAPYVVRLSENDPLDSEDEDPQHIDE